MQTRFVKIAADGSILDASATAWAAVLDNKTGLMWAVETSEVENWNAAESTAKACRAGGSDDWRLPTVDELFALADRTKYSPAIDTEYFPETPSDWFWSSTPWAQSPGGYAWGVFFYYGVASCNSQGSSGFVRAVRVGQ